MQTTKQVSFVVLRTVFGTLGIAASLFLIFVMWVSSKLKRGFYRILLYIAIGNAVRSLAITITIEGLGSGDPWCVIQGVLIQFNTWVIISWELCLTVHLYLNSINLEDTKNRERIYHVVCWGISLIFTIIPLAAGKYGPAITWCWVGDTRWRIGVLYAEYAVIILVVFFLYGKVIYSVCTIQSVTLPRQPEEERRIEIYKRQVRPMILYPFIVLVEGIVPISFRTYNLINPNADPSFLFSLVFTISVLVWGLPFVAVYVLDPVTRGEISLIRVNCIKKLGKFKKRRSHVQRTRSQPKRQTRDPDKTMSIISIEPTTVANPEAENTLITDETERGETAQRSDT
ncbi:putative cyclic AMP receptor-like protein A-like isoform X2 [Apostichopus japonicus]|uniref:Putative cyclic AMP receptor-like protein A-like isoform X2 n=1 Tax=Stichopus japonicus TaxID=307972 RepID=A0A2G8LB39_STIJA|nr:putative cyclic AMP receptor-like protein A-like isoform X2 [Apostichopus japonicus]